MVTTVTERLREAASLFEERNAAYGSNYEDFGKVMESLFPDGLSSKPLTSNDFRRLVLVCHVVTKLTRYCRNFSKGGHVDSLSDLTVYAMMLQETDEMALVEKYSVKRDVSKFAKSPKQEFMGPGGGLEPPVDPPEASIPDEWSNRV